MALKAVFEEQRTATLPELRIAAVGEVPEGAVGQLPLPRRELPGHPDPPAGRAVRGLRAEMHPPALPGALPGRQEPHLLPLPRGRVRPRHRRNARPARRRARSTGSKWRCGATRSLPWEGRTSDAGSRTAFAARRYARADSSACCCSTACNWCCSRGRSTAARCARSSTTWLYAAISAGLTLWPGR